VASAATRETVEIGGKAVELWGTPSVTAHDKALWLTQFKRFVQSGFSRGNFTKRLYDGLHVSMFGHIAEYNIHGFYEVWFSGPEERARWVHYVNRGGAFGLHSEDRKDCWGDIERACLFWLQESGMTTAIIKAAGEKVRSDELAILAALKAKYPDA
jgi:hypothetical protein